MSLDDLHSLSDFEYPLEQPPAAPPPEKGPEGPKKPEKKPRRFGRRRDTPAEPVVEPADSPPATPAQRAEPAAKPVPKAEPAAKPESKPEPEAVPWYRTRGWRIAGKAAGFLLALLWLVLISGTLILRTFGYEPLVVQTSSMEPTVDAGDLMISTTRTEPIQVGQIYIGIAPNTGLPTAHRVTGSGPDPDCWITKGDNNDAVDPYCLTTAQLDRQIVGWVPYGGFVNNFLAQPLVRMLMFVAPLLLFLPPIIRGFRSQKKPELAEGSDENGEPGDGEPPVGLRIGRVDKVVSLLVALAIFGVLGARLYLGLVPAVVGEVNPGSPLSSGAMALTQMTPVTDLNPGDVVLVAPPGESLASLQLLVDAPDDPTILPPEPGNTGLEAVDALAPEGAELVRMQFPNSAELPLIVYEIPKLGALLPVLATTAGFAGIMILLGLFGTILVMRVLLSTGNTQKQKAPAGNVA